MHKLDMVLDFQYGSTGKGLIAGWLAKRMEYDTVTCAFATNAGHTYRDGELTVMTQQLPTGIISPTVKNILIGPGALIHAETLRKEIERYGHFLEGKRLLIHPNAAVVEDYHARNEGMWGYTKIGSTAKGVGAAMIERIMRDPESANTTAMRWGVPRVLSSILHHTLAKYVVTTDEYDEVMAQSDRCLVEGAQGFSLSMYHGPYPYTTSRDVTPWQVAADCGLPFKWASSIQVIGTLRTFPIRVNNRDGSSGPAYPDQHELTWDRIGVDPELTTVTKLPRRVFTFSHLQFQKALWHCGTYWQTKLFLNFANYLEPDQVIPMIKALEKSSQPLNINHAKVCWVGWGPDDSDVRTVDNLFPEGVDPDAAFLPRDADSEGGHAD